MRVAFLVALLLPQASGQFSSFAMEREGDTMKVTLGSPGDATLPIVGSPYSAERTSEVVNARPDGTKVTWQQKSEKIWRDSQGRMRSEHQVFGSPEARFSYVSIVDPVGCFIYVIDDVNKVTHRSALSRCRPMQSRPAARPADALAVPVPPTPETIKVGTGVQAGQSSSMPLSSYETLGERNVGGVMAFGTRTTTRYPVGAIGNDRPLVTVYEMWSSKLYGGEVLSTSTGGLSGDTTNRLINIVLGEPDASQFQPPVGYAVIDEKQMFTITLRKK
jgi:hypothetical protein